MATETNVPKGQFFPGSDVTWNIPVTDAAGDPVDLSSYTLQFIVRRPDGTELLSKTTGSGITLADRDGTSDLAQVEIDRLDTAGAAAPGPGYTWALWRTDDPNDTPFAYGTLYMTPI